MAEEQIPFNSPELTPEQRKNFLRNIFRPITVVVPGTSAATATNYGVFFISDRSYYVVPTITERHRTAGTNGSAVTLNIEKCEDGVAEGSGVDLLSTAFDLKGTADTVQYGTPVNNTTYLTLKKGDALVLKDAGTLTDVAHVCVSLLLQEF